MLDQGMDGPDCDAGHVVDDPPLPLAGGEADGDNHHLMYQLELERVKLQIERERMERLQLEWRIEQDRVRVSRGTVHDVSVVERQTDLSMLR